MKIVTVVGARPQFIKAAAVSRVIQKSYTSTVEETLLHTGQHYDENMSDVFFRELDIPDPKYNLEISGGNHGEMTGRMLEGVEKVLLQECPDLLLIYGDTNSTLAGALAAAKLRIPVAHVEAGLRSFRMSMPEEVNRILADRISTMLFCPTKTAVSNLKAEGIHKGVYEVGDVMYDAALYHRDFASEKSNILNTLDLKNNKFALATCHRAENTDNPERLNQILLALGDIAKVLPVIIPLHPRTLKLINQYGLAHEIRGLNVIDPLPFIDMITLEQASSIILTDSGGMQKEAYFFRVPCLTMRDETEWVETIEANANILVGANRSVIIDNFDQFYAGNWRPDYHSLSYGDGDAAKKIVQILTTYKKN
jgi:UDP-GlcNAc3NAcA epimerase